MARFPHTAVLLVVILSFFLLFSCGRSLQPVFFHVTDPLMGLSREACEGTLQFSKSKKLEYRYATVPEVLGPASLELSYTVIIPVEADSEIPGRIVLEYGEDFRVLPLSPVANGIIMHYSIPAADPLPDRFGISFIKDESGTAKNRPGKEKTPVMQIYSVEYKDQWYGYYRMDDDSGVHLYASPFVSRLTDGSAWVFDPPAPFGTPDGCFPVFSAILQDGGEAALIAKNLRFEASPRLSRFNIPPGIIAPDALPLILEGDRPADFRLSYSKLPAFPEPVTADPGMVLVWPLGNWRDSRFEIYKWEQFPSILIFDFADYAIQDRMLKRLAFFVEKAGFRGRLSTDREIADQHGWNAHDYRAGDLARFFRTARETNFPLLAEEYELERILLHADIIRESGGRITAGEGGIISISRETSQYLRTRFMAHEAFHGIFFIDEEFRDFSRRRWQQFPDQAKRFILSAFDYYQYDITDDYLVVNEFMAYIMQQPVTEAGSYFGEYLPSIIERYPHRRAALPPKGPGGWPSLAAAFTREAEAFSAYANDRWGLAAGRVNLITISRL